LFTIDRFVTGLHQVLRCGYRLYGSNSSMGTSSASLPTIALATFQTWIKLSSAALQSTQGSLKFQLKSDIRFV